MELIECSETSAYCKFNQTPGKYPKEYIHLDSKHGESLKSRTLCMFAVSSEDVLRDMVMILRGQNTHRE